MNTPLLPQTNRTGKRIMSLSFFAACALSLATVVPARAGTAPILDLRASNGEIVDASKAARLLKTPRAETTPDGSISITGEAAISIPYGEGDRLFQSGPFTWIIKAKFKSPAALTDDQVYGLFWRWNYKNERSVCLQLYQGHTLSFLISADGGLESLSFVSLPVEVVPPDEWVTFVCRFDPGKRMSVELYDRNNELLKMVEKTKGVPEAFFAESNVDFNLGTPEALGYSIGRIQVWDECLPDEEIPALLGK